MAAMIDVLRVVESPITLSSDGNIRWSLDYTGWFPSDVISISSAVFTLKDITGTEIAGKVTGISTSTLAVLFTLSGIDPGSYTLYAKTTANTGDVDTCYCEVFIPY